MTADADQILQLRNWTLSRQERGRSVSLIQGLDLTLKPGRWLAVLGANGSGKSSLLKFLASDDSPLTVPRSIIFQDPDEQIIASSVEQELALGRPDLDPVPVLADFGLEELAHLDPRLLSAGQKQRLVLAVALGSGPQVLLGDEPTALQDARQAAWVLDQLDSWRRRTGGALVTATCDRREAMRADELLVLGQGKVLARGPAAELMALPEVLALLDSPHTDQNRPERPARPLGSRDPVLTLEQVGCRLLGPGGGFAGVDLQVQPGERVGLIGPNGCGKSTLLAACVGARRPDAGRILVKGRPLYGRRTRDLDHGLALLAPQFPEYFFTRATTAAELSLDPEVDRPAELLPAMGLPADVAGRNPHALSSGQKRRLALGLVLFSHRPLLLLDEPTAALDRRGRQLVADLVDQVPPETALVIASHDHAFLERTCHRVLELGPGGVREAVGP